MTPEEVKNARKLAYQKAKALRDTNPAYLALKEKHLEMQRKRKQEQTQRLKAIKKEALLVERKAKAEALVETTGLTEALRLLKFE